MPWLIFAGAVLLLLFVLLFLLFPGHPSEAQREMVLRRNFAHRGLHDVDRGVPENSLAAFDAAANAGYAMELDIRFTADEEIVVFHDPTLTRICGIEGKVEDYTKEQLSVACLSGTDQKIPTFAEVLSLVHGRTPLLIEVKPGDKRDLLCEKAYAMLQSYPGEYCIESFDPHIVRWFKKNAPQVLRGQLSSPAKDLRPSMGWGASFALGNLFTNVLARPQFIAYSLTPKSGWVRFVERLGCLKFCWTSREEASAPRKEAANDGVIFEGYRPAPRYPIPAKKR